MKHNAFFGVQKNNLARLQTLSNSAINLIVKTISRLRNVNNQIQNELNVIVTKEEELAEMKKNYIEQYEYNERIAKKFEQLIES